MAESKYKSYYRRHLPHIHPTQAQYFVTFRLANSLPTSIIEELQTEFQELRSNTKLKNNDVRYKQYQLYFDKFDQLLDSSQTGDLWLKKPEIADCVYEAINYQDGRSYDLIACTIMPNHVHLLFDHSIERSGQPIYSILQSIKKYSARRGNKLLKRIGKTFWQNESYDHVVRSEQESEDVIRYIIYNSVKAGLCKNWIDWKWTYIKREYKELFL